MRASFALLVLTLSILPKPAAAQCTGGQQVAASCAGLPSWGCCDWEDFVEHKYWCEGGVLCRADCEATADPYDIGMCGFDDLSQIFTCGAYSMFNPDFESGQCPAGLGSGGGGTSSGGACGAITFEGCCDGQTLTWCDDGELTTQDCSDALLCGWDYGNGWYSCGTDGEPDPTGGSPMSCSGGSSGGGGGTATGLPCGVITYEGCCEGQLLKWCVDGELHQGDCSPSPACGWHDVGYYDCDSAGGADPSGVHPKTCGASGSSGGGTSGGCTPSCGGIECGPDGCGGSCGSCPYGMSCSNGACVTASECVPSCLRGDGTVKQCGDNGCGGMCGSCGIELFCSAEGDCVDENELGCNPGCGNRECGPDDCGSVCGTCEEGKGCYEGFCVVGMDCVPACEGRECGPDGCGGVCGECLPGGLCSGTGQCEGGDAGGAQPESDDDLAPSEDGTCPPGQTLHYGLCVNEDDSNPPVIMDPAAGGDGGPTQSGCALVHGGHARLSSLLMLWMVGLGLIVVRRRPAPQGQASSTRTIRS